jgi:hypothetical protein
MTTPGGRKGHHIVNVREIEEGQTVKLSNGDWAVVTTNPKDGYWLEIQYLYGPKSSGENSQSEMVFAEDVVEVVLN